MSKNKLTFFENVYYWIWYIFPKPPQYGNEPAPFTSLLVSVFKIFNGMFIVIFLSSFLSIDTRGAISKVLLGEFKWFFVLTISSLAYFLIMRNDNYEKNFDAICDKIKSLTSKQRRIRILVFFLYIIASIGLLVSILYFKIGYSKTEKVHESVVETTSDSTHFDFEKYRQKYEQK